MIPNAAELIDNLRALPDETEYVEFKRNFSEAEKEAEDISALANSAAYHGVSAAFNIWGIDDATHEVTGITFKPRNKKRGNQSLEMWLRQHLSDNANFEFAEVTYDQKPLVILKVWPAAQSPVAFNHHAYIRTDSSTQPLKTGSAREAELWRRIQNKSFEAQIAKEQLPLDEALDLLDYPRYFDLLDIPLPPDEETVSHYLEKDEILIQPENGRWGITNLGALLFAKDLSSFPTVRRKGLRIARYAGKNRAAERSERSFPSGYALSLDDAFLYLEGLTAAGDSLNGLKSEPRSLYPAVSLRETIVNALIHQDLGISGAGPMVEVFVDRIEVTSPGELLVETVRIVNDPPRSRNETLSALMRRFRYCEEAGSGWDKIVLGSEALHTPAPRIEIRPESMQVTLFQPKAYKDMTPDERLQACYWHACVTYESNDYLTNASLRERFGIAPNNSAQVSRLIREAVEQGTIKPVNPDASPKFMQYKPSWA